MKILEVNSENLKYNIEVIKKRANKTKIIAVVKGNAYGLGLEKFVNFLVKNGINYFAVSSVEEAVELASFNMNIKILCMEATSIESDLRLLLDKDIIITIDNFKAGVLLNKLARSQKKKATVHLKIDTGFSRYGFDFSNKEEILNTVLENPSILVEGVYSHFSSSYLDNGYTDLQLNRFLEIKNFLEEKNIKIPIYHIANSSAFLTREDTFFDAVRIGSVFLGRISVKNNIGLKRIGMLKSNVVDIKSIDKGAPIGYSNSAIAKRNIKIAVVPLGYADGFNVEISNDTFKFVDKLRILKNSIRNLFKDNRIYVNINDYKCLVLGRIGMNHFVVDITDKQIKLNDEVKIDVSPILISSRIEREYK